MQTKTTTVRFPPELAQALADYAKHEDISKNQAIKKAVRLLVGKPAEKAR